MIPGMGGRGGMNPKKLNAMMKQMGISMEDIDNVEEVIIRTPSREYVFKDAEVSVMTAQGQKTYQVVGNPTVIDRKGAPAAKMPASGFAQGAAPASGPVPLFSEEDVALVAEQAGVTKEQARKALAATKGEVAEAVVALLDEKE